VIKYLGSKRTLLPVILEAVGRDATARSVLDVFSGTSRVGHALKAAGYRVIANDHNTYAATLATCYVQADAEDINIQARQLVDEYNQMPGEDGYFTQTFCLQSRFFQPKNGARIDAIREDIDRKALPPELRAVMLVSLMEAADRVDSTTGLQMAYLKSWAPRSFNDLQLRVPDVLPRAAHGKGLATNLDALVAASTLQADIAYVDPPYNQHSYLGNYHIWESLVRWDKPEVYGVACKRMDVRTRQSAFNSKRKFMETMTQLLANIRAPTIVISFNNEGYISREAMEQLLASLWQGSAHVNTIENDFKRYVGAKIGIYSPSGLLVGKVSHVTNKEYLYVVTRARAAPHDHPAPAPPRHADLRGGHGSIRNRGRKRRRCRAPHAP